MKIKLIVALTALFLNFNVRAQNQLKISIDIRGRSCSGGLGLCSSNPLTEKEHSIASAQKIGESTVLIEIDKIGLSVENQFSIVGKEFYRILSSDKFDFIQESDINFDKDTLIKLGFDTKLSLIRKGNYPMIIENDKIIVVFTLFED